MKKLLLYGLLALVSCKSKDPGLTSPEGKWGYTTPDGKIAVTFDVIKTGSNAFDIQNQTMKIAGTPANAEKEVVGFTATAFQKIRINANDVNAVYPFDIIFNNATISSDFKFINVPTTTYTYPWGTVNNLSSITIERI